MLSFIFNYSDGYFLPKNVPSDLNICSPANMVLQYTELQRFKISLKMQSGLILRKQKGFVSKFSEKSHKCAKMDTVKTNLLPVK
jgi:hypothetical protein